MNMQRMKRMAILFLLSAFMGSTFIFSGSQVVDRIVAVVNEEVITLTDVRIAEAFGLYAEEIGEEAEDPRSLILQKLIDQKVVTQLSVEEVLTDAEKLDENLMRITQKLGAGEVEKRLAHFGLGWENLKDFLREKMVYQTIISQRFSKVNPVSLKEIEEYYQRSYVPAQREMGVEPKPMMEILDEIESGIKQEKIKAQIRDWVKNIREKSDIQIIKGDLKSPE
jgi:peptidyl-prolyl cis-trans isomerase SurA